MVYRKDAEVFCPIAAPGEFATPNLRSVTPGVKADVVLFVRTAD